MLNNSQLFCFTYAGGTASFFDNIKNHMKFVDLVSFDYAGHGKRFREPFYKSFSELADDLYIKLKEKYTGGHYSLFGYSMGTISVVEILKRIIESSSIRAPDYVFLAAHEPFSKNFLCTNNKLELDNLVKKITIGFGDIPEELINNQSFWRMYLPIYRADYSIINEYNFDNLLIRFDIPSVIFYSEKDTPYDRIKHWDNYFSCGCDYHEYNGSHFFMKDHYSEIANIINDKIGAINDI